MSTFGERCAEDVRCYLNTNGLKQSQLKGAEFAELIDRRLKHETIQAAKKKKLATEEEWLKSVEALPHLKVVDVRKELAKCQFWCRERGKICTRRRFTNWLSKDDLAPLTSPGGRESSRINGHAAPAGWLAKLNQLFPDATLAKGGIFEILKETDYQWEQLPASIRADLERALI